MEGAKTRTESEERAPETILQQDDGSEIVTGQSQASTDSHDPSGRESTARVESENQLRLFVTLLTARVLRKCHALQKHKREEWVAHIKRLVNQTMEGLAVTEDFSMDAKSIKTVCKAVLKDLRKKFCGQLETVILLQDPAVDAVIIQSLQAHIKDLPAQLAKKAASRKWWKELLQVMAFTAGLLATLVLIASIP